MISGRRQPAIGTPRCTKPQRSSTIQCQSKILMGHSTSTSTQPTQGSLSRQSQACRRLLILTLCFGIQPSSPPSALRALVLLHPPFRGAPRAGQQQQPRTTPPVAVSLQTPQATRFLVFLRGCTSSYRSYS